MYHPIRYLPHGCIAQGGMSATRLMGNSDWQAFELPAVSVIPRPSHIAVVALLPSGRGSDTFLMHI